MSDYGEFRKQYEERHQASVPARKPIVNEYPSWLYWAVGGMFFSAAVLSGVHTVPTVFNTIEVNEIITPLVRSIASLLSFVAVELAIFISAYAAIRGSKVFVTIVLATSFIVAIVSNLQSVSRALSGSGAGVGTLVVIVALGVGMPLIALMAGKMFVDMHRANRTMALRTEHEYTEAWKAFEAEILSAYEAFERKQDRRTGRTLDIHPVRADIGRTDSGQGVQRPSGFGYDRSSDAKDKVKTHLEDHPEDFQMSVRTLADKLGVGKSTVADVRKMLQPELSTNGNGHHEEAQS